MLLRVENEEARNFYINEAISGNWSARQLEREINTFSYQRYLASHGNHDVVDDTAKREKSGKNNQNYYFDEIFELSVCISVF